MSTGKFVSYLRVSTDKQGRSGLGIEAQREAVERYLNGGDWKLVAEYVETESGRKPQRPKLTAALAHAKAIGATVVIAKLDRLTRNVDVLRSLWPAAPVWCFAICLRFLMGPWGASC
jgi:DNA invertase Pin-like site-specific DNA recombinase